MSKPSALVQPALTLRPEAAAAAAAAPARVEPWEYAHGDEPWRCWKPAELAAEFDLTQADLPEFHAAVCGLARGWLLVRRRYGIVPVLPPAGMEADDLRPWGAPELCAALGITRGQMQQELDAVRGVWTARRAPAPAPEPEPVLTAERPGELDLTEAKDVLAEFGIAFKVQTAEERQRFVARAEALRPLLREPAAAGMTRELLTAEYRLAQLDAALNEPERIGGKEWRELLKVRNDLADSYERTSRTLLDQFPWAAQVNNKVTLKGVLSEITEAVVNYQARGDTALIDGLFTALEIQVLCRQSVQAPEPKYRAGKVVYLNAARAGIMDPTWKSPFSHAWLKAVTRAWSDAYQAGAREGGLPVVDLVSNEEYPALPGENLEGRKA